MDELPSEPLKLRHLCMARTRALRLFKCPQSVGFKEYITAVILVEYISERVYNIKIIADSWRDGSAVQSTGCFAEALHGSSWQTITAAPADLLFKPPWVTTHMLYIVTRASTHIHLYIQYFKSKNRRVVPFGTSHPHIYTYAHMHTQTSAYKYTHLCMYVEKESKRDHYVPVDKTGRVFPGHFPFSAPFHHKWAT